jgi:hypothetical protein
MSRVGYFNLSAFLRTEVDELGSADIEFSVTSRLFFGYLKEPLFFILFMVLMLSFRASDLLSFAYFFLSS